MRSRVPLLFLTAMTATLAAQDVLLSYGSMIPNSDGRIDYRLVAKVPVWRKSLSPVPKPLPVQQPIDGPDPVDVRAPFDDGEVSEPVLDLVTVERTLRTHSAYWVADWGLYDPRPLTRDQVLGAGVTAAELLALERMTSFPVDREANPITFTEESRMVSNGPATPYVNIGQSHRRVGNLDLFAVLPADHEGGRWGLTLTSALGEERSLTLTLAPGARHIQVQGIEAGNCLVKLFALTASGAIQTYFQEVPVVVRKHQPGVARIAFTGYRDPARHRIASLSLGQNSQVQDEGNEALPLQEGKDAMVRVMIADQYGEGGNGGMPCQVRLTLEWQGNTVWAENVDTRARPHLARTGRVGDYFGLTGPVIPGDRVKAGAILRAMLFDKASGQKHHETTLSPQVIRPRHIVIHGYDVRPHYIEWGVKWTWWGGPIFYCYPVWGAGAPLVRDEATMNAHVLPQIQEVFPYSTIQFKFEGRVWLPMFARGADFSNQVYTAMQVMQGWHQTDANAPVEHIYLGMVNSAYGNNTMPGQAWYGYRAMAITQSQDYRCMGYLIAHELGHTFRLEHAPSEGANAYFAGWHHNRIDDGYPYGGGGLTGGWGYSKLGNWFLSEDAHTRYNLQPHWDLMSYTQGYTFMNTNVSDYFTRKYLIPSWAYQSAPTGSAPRPSDAVPELPAEDIQGGVPVFGAAAEDSITQKFQALGFLVEPAPAVLQVTATAAPKGTVVHPSIEVEDETIPGFATPEAIELDPSKGTPDDPTPPVAVFKRLPVVTVPPPK